MTFLAALLLVSLASLHAAESKLNVLLMLSDDLSYPHVDCYGNKDILTPNLDKFAAEGMCFDRAVEREHLHGALAGGLAAQDGMI